VCREWKTAIVTPLAVPVFPRALLAQFLRDPLAGNEGLAFVCGQNWDDAGVSALRALALFYGVDAAVVRIAGKATAAAALDAAAQIANASYVLLLGANTIGRTPGWRRAMHAALQASGGACCVSPTVLYEDDSIRFAGADAIEPLQAAPYVRVRRRRAGMPASLAGLGKPETSFAASLACCLMPAAIIDAIGGARRAMATASGEEAELFLRVQLAGIKCVWAPAAQVYATDEAEAGQSGAQKVGSLIDGWRLRARLTAARKD
jgi:GT2 family glycosyltransferase